MRPATRRLLHAAAAAAAVAAGLAYAFWPRPIPVDLAAVERGRLLVTIDEEGETRVRDVYQITAPVAGRLLRIEMEVGDPVTGGETIVASIQETVPTFLDIRAQRQAEAKVHAAEAALSLARAKIERARAELQFARADLERARRLVREGHVAERTLQRAELEVRTREAALEAAKAELEMRRSDLESARAALIEPEVASFAGPGQACCVQLRAPVSGRILRIFNESERVVQAGTPLLEIGDPNDLEVVVDLLSQDAVKVVEGTRVLIEGWGGGQVLEGRVRRVEPYAFTKVSALGIEEQRVNVIVDFTDPEAAARALGHGYRVIARIVVWQGEDVLKLPLGALFRAGEDWAVFVYQDGRARLRQVTIGHRNDSEAEVLTGLEAGSQVVLHPSDRIADGVRITPRVLTPLG